MPIIDPHHHLWDARTQPKGWPLSAGLIKMLFSLRPKLLMAFINGDLKGKHPEVLKAFSEFNPFVQPYMAPELLADMENRPQGGGEGGGGGAAAAAAAHRSQRSAHDVRHTVYIECGWQDESESEEAMRTVGEAGMAQRVADASGNRLCAGIVAHVDLRLGAAKVRPALEALVKRYPNVRGIRFALAHTDPSHGIMGGGHGDPGDATSTPAFREAFALLSEFELSFDTWLYHENLEVLRDIAMANPTTSIICDHIGLPLGLAYGRDAAMEEWRGKISALAADCPNVSCKLSGLGMCALGFGYEHRPRPPNSVELAKAWGPYVRHCLDCFGVDRCMFASNFPVDKVSCSYTALYNAFKRIVRDLPREDREKLFFRNAARVYRLAIDF